MRCADCERVFLHSWCGCDGRSPVPAIARAIREFREEQPVLGAFNPDWLLAERIVAEIEKFSSVGRRASWPKPSAAVPGGQQGEVAAPTNGALQEPGGGPTIAEQAAARTE